jgi:hypothetical protein
MDTAMLGSFQGHMEVVKILLEGGANLPQHH